MPPTEDADLDIDFDAELAGIQAQAHAQAEAETAAIQGQVMGKDDEPDADVIEISAQDVVDDGMPRFEWKDRRFRVAAKTGLMPMLKFFSAANKGARTGDTDGLVAMYQMLRDCIYAGEPSCGECAACTAADAGARDSKRVTDCPHYDAGDWGAFEDYAIDTKAEGDELFEAMNAAMLVISGRPTGPSPASSAGRREISGASTGRSSARRGRGSRR